MEIDPLGTTNAENVLEGFRVGSAQTTNDDFSHFVRFATEQLQAKCVGTSSTEDRTYIDHDAKQ